MEMISSQSYSNNGHKSIILMAFLLLLLSSVYVNAGYLQDGYALTQPETIPSSCTEDEWSTNGNCYYGAESGTWDKISNATYKTFSPDSLKIPLLRGQMVNGSLEYYVIGFYSTYFSIFRFNATTKIFQKVIDYNYGSIGVDQQYFHSNFEAVLFKFEEDPEPTLIFGTELQIGTTRYYNITKLWFDGTTVKSRSGGKIHIGIAGENSGNSAGGYNIGCSDALDVCLFRSSATLDLLNSSHIIATTTGNIGSKISKMAIGSLTAPASCSNCRSAVWMDDDMDTGSPNVDLIVYQFNRTHLIGADTNFDGDSDILSIIYSCSNGVCDGISDNGYHSSPMMTDTDTDGLEEIVLAVGSYSAVFTLDSYGLMVIDNDGSMLWDSTSLLSTSSDSGLSSCGNNYKNNITFYQPAFMDMAEAYMHIDGYYISPTAVCGACQPQNSQITYLSCFDLYNGKLLLDTTIDMGKHLSNTRRTVYKYPVLQYKYGSNVFVSNSIDSSSAYEININGKILDEHGNLEQSLNYVINDTYEYVIPIIPFDAYNTIDKSYIFSKADGSTRVYITGNSNSLPSFTIGTVKENPCSTRPVCLNFTMASGIFTEWSYSDDTDPIYISWAEDINDLTGNNPVYANWSNWTYESTGSFSHYVHYNTTGYKTMRFRVTDYYHTSSYIEDTITFNVVDNNYPFCESSYDTQCVTNEAASTTTTAEEDESAILASLGLSENDTVTYQFQHAGDSLGIVTSGDKTIITFIILLIANALFIFLGMKYNMPKGVFIAIAVFDFLFIVFMTVIGWFYAWLFWVIAIMVALIGAGIILNVLSGSGSGG